MKMKSVLLLGALVAFSSACSLKKTAEDTRDTTKEMNETTKEMSKDTKDMKDTTKELADKTKEMNDQTKELGKSTDVVRDRTVNLEYELTYKESYREMMNNLDWLFAQGAYKKNDGIIKGTWNFFFGTNEDPDLFMAAGATIRSMYFQFWKGDHNEDSGELDGRVELGAEILFDRVFTHKGAPTSKKVDVFYPSRAYKGMAALGAKMDEIADFYARSTRERGLPSLTFYDFVKMALRNRLTTERHAKFPRAVAKILQWEPEAIYLLQLRHNALPLMVLSRTSDLLDRNDVRKLTLKWSGSQEIDISGANAEQLREWTAWLNNASETRRFLREVGIEPEYNGNIQALVATANFVPAEIFSREPKNAKESLQQEFVRAYKRVVCEAKIKKEYPAEAYQTDSQALDAECGAPAALPELGPAPYP